LAFASLLLVACSGEDDGSAFATLSTSGGTLSSSSGDDDADSQGESGEGETGSEGEDTTSGDGDGDGDDGGTTTGGPADCGDGVVGGFEDCDCGGTSTCEGDQLGASSCADYDAPGTSVPYSGGTLGCNLSCQHITTGCFVCGDANLAESEPCDGALIGPHTCGSEGFLSGSLSCTAECSLDTSACVEANFVENWESGGFAAAPWGAGGSTGWVITSSDANGGVYSAHSGAIGGSGTTELVLDMDFAAAGSIAYFHRESSESCCDELTFLIDGVEQGSAFGGTTEWTESSFAVAAGTHRMTWRYSKDGSVDSGEDRVWIDDIRATGSAATPVCGDAFLGTGEACDGTLFAPGSCGSEGFLGGTLGCTPQCEFDTAGCTMASFIEDWESGDFSQAAWSFAGNANWSVDMTQAQSGVYSAASGAIAGSQNSDLSITLNFAAAGVLAFSHSESTESCCDELHFLIDGIDQANWAGEGSWTDESYNVAAGTHTFTWRYEKDSSVDSGADRVYVDDIRSDGVP